MSTRIQRDASRGSAAMASRTPVAAAGLREHVTVSRGPDPVVFGTFRASPDYGSLLTRCRACDVKWSPGSGGRCWICGRSSCGD